MANKTDPQRCHWPHAPFAEVSCACPKQASFVASLRIRRPKQVFDGPSFAHPCSVVCGQAGSCFPNSLINRLIFSPLGGPWLHQHHKQAIETTTKSTSLLVSLPPVRHEKPQLVRLGLQYLQGWEESAGEVTERIVAPLPFEQSGRARQHLEGMVREVGRVIRRPIRFSRQTMHRQPGPPCQPSARHGRGP